MTVFALHMPKRPCRVDKVFSFCCNSAAISIHIGAKSLCPRHLPNGTDGPMMVACPSRYHKNCRLYAAQGVFSIFGNPSRICETLESRFNSFYCDPRGIAMEAALACRPGSKIESHADRDVQSFPPFPLEALPIAYGEVALLPDTYRLGKSTLEIMIYRGNQVCILCLSHSSHHRIQDKASIINAVKNAALPCSAGSKSTNRSEAAN